MKTVSLVFLLIGIIHIQIYAFEDTLGENIVAHPKFLHGSINRKSPSTDDDVLTPSLHDRRSESAERYFNWIEKNQRPMEYFRGKRFWLFAKKDDNANHVEYFPMVNTKQNSLEQGLWRSGIVGRRRR